MGYAKGFCSRGGRCTFAHNREQVQTLPDLTCTKLCPLGEGCSNKACRFAHRRCELRKINSLSSQERFSADSSPVASTATTEWGSSCGRDANSDSDADTESVASLQDESSEGLPGAISFPPNDDQLHTSKHLSDTYAICRVHNTFIECGIRRSDATFRRSRSCH